MDEDELLFDGVQHRGEGVQIEAGLEQIKKHTFGPKFDYSNLIFNLWDLLKIKLKKKI
jgi:hypothetical protein